jgi:hypothetical protein
MRLFLGRLLHLWWLHPFLLVFYLVLTLFVTNVSRLLFFCVLQPLVGGPVAGIFPVNSSQHLAFDRFNGGSYAYPLDENQFIPHARPFDFVDVSARVKSDSLQP